MDLNQQIAYNGWSNRMTRNAGLPIDGWEVIRADVTNVGATQYMDKRALQDGMDANDIYLNGRQISMILGVYGSTQGSFWDNMQTVLAAFNPHLAYNADSANLGFLPLTFYQPTAITSTWDTATYPHGIPLQYYARPYAEPTFPVDSNATAGAKANKGLAGHVGVSLLCRDPRKYLQSQQVLTMTQSTQTATYRGDYPTLPIVTFTMSATGSSAFTIIVNSTSIVIDLSTRSNSLQLDFSKRTLTDLSVPPASFARFITSAPDYPAISSGSTFKVNNITGISTAQLSYREAFA